MGHSHVVVQQLTGFGQTTPTDPTKFAFFKALNNPAVNGVLTGDVTGGLPAGYYRIAVFHSGMNHQPSASHSLGRFSLKLTNFHFSRSSYCSARGYG